MKYTDPGAAYYEERHRQRVLSNLQRRAKAFGPPGPPSGGSFLRKVAALLGIPLATPDSDDKS